MIYSCKSIKEVFKLITIEHENPYTLLELLLKLLADYEEMKGLIEDFDGEIDRRVLEEFRKLLEDGTIDIGLVGEPDASFSHTFAKINSIEDIFVTTQSYLDHLMIRTGKDFYTLTDKREIFQDATLMLMDKENLSRRYIEQFLLENDIHADNLIEVSTMDSLIEFATIGIGIACVIKDFAEEELKNGTLIELPMPFAIPKRNIGFVYQKKQFKNPALESFLEFCKNF